MEIEISERPTRNELAAIQRLADNHRAQLGFLPRSAYEDAALKRQIFVARGEDGLAGYLLIGGRYPQCRVYQILVAPEYRRLGIGRSLLDHLKSWCETGAWASIIAHIADDLDQSRSFYQKNEFSKISEKPGGRVRGRTIDVLLFELSTPVLFSVHDSRSAVANTPKSDQSYLIDLNCLIDIGSGRRDLPELERVIREQIRQEGPIYLSSESYTELQRGGLEDRVTELANSLPAYDPPDPPLYTEIYNKLNILLFENKNLSDQQNSDMRQFLTAFHHGIGNFVTGDRAFLRKAQILEQNFGVAIVAPTEFERIATDSDIGGIFQRTAGGTISIGKERNIAWSEAISLLDQFTSSTYKRNNLFEEIQSKSDWVQQDIQINGIRGASLLTAGPPRPKIPGSAILLSTPACASDRGLLETLIELSLRRFAALGQTCFTVDANRHIASLEPVLLSAGFTKHASRWLRHVVGVPILPKEWPLIANSLTGFGAITFGDRCPTKISGELKLDGRRASVATVEKLLGPTLFLLRSRPGIIIPIKSLWADELLGTGRQRNLFAQKSASLRPQRTYFKSPRNKDLFTVGATLCFYESGGDNKGRSAIVAFARCTGARKLSKSEIRHELYRTAVLDADLLNEVVSNEHVLAVSFDMIIPAPSLVSINWLREHQIVGGQNLITAQQISGDQVQKIWKRARQ